MESRCFRFCSHSLCICVDDSEKRRCGFIRLETGTRPNERQQIDEPQIYQLLFVFCFVTNYGVDRFVCSPKRPRQGFPLSNFCQVIILAKILVSFGQFILLLISGSTSILTALLRSLFLQQATFFSVLAKKPVCFAHSHRKPVIFLVSCRLECFMYGR